MKILFYIFIIVYGLGTNNSLSQKSYLNEIRQEYSHVTGNTDKANKIYNKLINKQNKNAVEQAYLGVIQSILAESYFNPFTKYSWFVDGKGNIEAAITKSPYDPEIRFLRLCVQHEAPKFLGYYSNIDEDKKIVLASAKYFKEIGIYQSVKDFLVYQVKINKASF